MGCMLVEVLAPESKSLSLLPTKSTLKDEEKLSHSKLYPSALRSTSKEPRHRTPRSSPSEMW